MKDKIIIISGPTATGKTALSISIAQHLISQNIHVEILNFDSLLFYKELSIGTAKPTLEEQKNIPHHMIDICSISNPMNAADFIKQASIILEKILAAKKIPILVGGSAFYLRALIKGMYETLEVPLEIKEHIEREYRQDGISNLWAELQAVDPESAQKLHINDHYRVLRAIEFYRATKTPISKERLRFDKIDPYDFSTAQNENWDLFQIYLDLDKKQHFEIICERTKKMLHTGLIDEVKNLLLNGFTGREKPMQSIGYKETLDFLAGKIKGLDELHEKISISTRQLAKSQRTFFAKIHPKIQHNPLESSQQLFREIEHFINR